MPSLSPFQKKQYERIIEHLKDDKSANLQFVLIPATCGVETGAEDQSKLFIPPASPEAPHQVTAAICLQYPTSRGSIHIQSADVSEQPSLEPNILSHPADAAVLAAGLKMMDRASRSEHLKGVLGKRVFPAPEKDMSDLKQGAAWVHEFVLSEYHPAGSCAMGDAVDSRLRVNGVRGLRVVDASVFPNQVSGNIVSSVYMVAEKAADMIKEDWDYAALNEVKASL